MRPDDDPQLRSAFDALHRRAEMQAPPFEAMRDRALRVARDSGIESASARSPVFLRAIGWAAAACAAVTAVWMVASDRDPRGTSEMASAAAPVEELITRIEDHVDFHTALALPEYPSDVLLASPDPDPSL